MDKSEYIDITQKLVELLARGVLLIVFLKFDYDHAFSLFGGYTVCVT